MSDSIPFHSYPIYITGNIEYWKAKKKFIYQRNSFKTWIMIAVENGLFSYAVDGVSGEAAQGDVLLVPPGKELVREIVQPLDGAFTQFLYDPAKQAEEQRIAHFLKELYGYKFTTHELDRLHNNLRQLYRLILHPGDPVGAAWKIHYFNDIWVLFRTDVENNIQRGNLVVDPMMIEAKEWIDRHAFDKVRISDLAASLNLHLVQLSRRFQKIYGMLPSHYLISLRMEKAKSLLVQTDYTMEHIAQLCGYDNGYYFSRMFTQYTRMNPSVFRRIHSATPL